MNEVPINKFFDLVSAKVSHDNHKRSADKGQITLGELRAELSRFDPDITVRFSDGGSPGMFMSYRGYYDMIAVNRDEAVTVGVFLDEVKSAIGATFEGYKGGDFRMTNSTPVWVSEYGRSEGNGIVGVRSEDDGSVVLEVAMIEDWD